MLMLIHSNTDLVEHLLDKGTKIFHTKKRDVFSATITDVMRTYGYATITGRAKTGEVVDIYWLSNYSSASILRFMDYLCGYTDCTYKINYKQ